MNAATVSTTEPAAAATTENAEDKPASPGGATLRDALIAKLKNGKSLPVEVKEAASKEEPKEAESKAEEKSEPDAAKTEADDKAKADEKPAEIDVEKMTADEFKKAKSDLKKDKADFGKYKFKREGKLEKREQAVNAATQEVATARASLEDHEKKVNAQITSHVESFKRDPIKWMNDQGVDVRATLMDFAKRDTEDPRDAKLRELEQWRAESLAEKKAREEREAADRTEQTEQQKATERQQAATAAQQKIASEAKRVYKRAADQYPTIALYLDADQVGQLVTNHVVETWRTERKELDYSTVLDQLEKELIAHDQKVAANRAKLNGGKSPTEARSSEPSERVRTVAKSEPVKPEARQSSRTEDVTSRSTSIRQVGVSAIDKDALKARLTKMVRERVR